MEERQLYKGALNDACLELAKCVLWTSAGTSSDIVETMAARFEEESLNHLEFIIGQGRDPNILTRAIKYLADAHGAPIGTDIKWFSEMMKCAIEMAVPNSGLSKGAAAFLNDVQEGVWRSIESAADQK